MSLPPYFVLGLELPPHVAFALVRAARLSFTGCTVCQNSDRGYTAGWQCPTHGHIAREDCDAVHALIASGDRSLSSVRLLHPSAIFEMRYSMMERLYLEPRSEEERAFLRGLFPERPDMVL